MENMRSLMAKGYREMAIINLNEAKAAESTNLECLPIEHKKRAKDAGHISSSKVVLRLV